MAETALVPTRYGGYESLAVSTSSAGFTAATYGAAQFAFVTCEGATVRFRLDGTAPTAAVGHELFPGDTLICHSAGELANANFISRDGVAATLRCSFGS